MHKACTNVQILWVTQWHPAGFPRLDCIAAPPSEGKGPVCVDRWILYTSTAKGLLLLRFYGLQPDRIRKHEPFEHEMEWSCTLYAVAFNSSQQCGCNHVHITCTITCFAHSPPPAIAATFQLRL